MSGMGVGIAFGASAVVCCVHDREKRVVRELAFNAAVTSCHLCACCENVFLEASDVPMFCPECRKPPKHMLGGPLATPVGRV